MGMIRQVGKNRLLWCLALSKRLKHSPAKSFVTQTFLLVAYLIPLMRILRYSTPGPSAITPLIVTPTRRLAVSHTWSWMGRPSLVMAARLKVSIPGNRYSPG